MPAASNNQLPTNGSGDSIPPRPPKSLKISAIVFGALLGAVVTVGFLIVIGALLNREIVPPLTQESYDAAVARWEKNGPTDYNCDIDVSGNRPGIIHVEVRAGQVANMTRDGETPSQRRTWDYWSVDGQLETIGQELDMLSDPRDAFGGGATALPTLNARFHPRLGYPEVYRRFVPGTQQDMSWKITRFEDTSNKQ